MAKHTVVIPRNPKERLELANQVFAKHQADGASSPLNALQEHNWTVNGPRAVQALAIHNQAQALLAQIEELFRERDILMAPVDQTTMASRDLLLGVHRANPKRLGDWGFVVNDPRPRKKKPGEDGEGNE